MVQYVTKFIFGLEIGSTKQYLGKSVIISNLILKAKMPNNIWKILGNSGHCDFLLLHLVFPRPCLIDTEWVDT